MRVRSAIGTPGDLADLESFEGYHVLSWTTATEMNASHFEVERRNQEGLFDPIGEVMARTYHETQDKPIYTVREEL